MPFPKIKLSDNDGNAVGVTDNRLNVNAYLSATPTIDIGDVSLLLGGTAASVNNGAADATTLRVTVASDSTGVLSVDDNGGSITVDGTFWQATQPVISSLAFGGFTYYDGVSKGFPVGGIRNDTLATLVGADNEFAPLQVNADGALYVDGSNATQPVSGTVTANLSSTDNTVLDNIQTAVELIDDAIYADDDDFTLNSSKGMVVMGLQSVTQNITTGDVGAITVDEHGQVRTVQNLGEPDTFAMIDVDNAVESLNSTVGTFTDCIEIILQADEDNTGYIMVGDGDVADNRGIKMNAGDTFILTAVDSRLISLWGSADNQNLRCMIMRQDI